MYSFVRNNLECIVSAFCEVCSYQATFNGVKHGLSCEVHLCFALILWERPFWLSSNGHQPKCYCDFPYKGNNKGAVFFYGSFIPFNFKELYIFIISLPMYHDDTTLHYHVIWAVMSVRKQNWCCQNLAKHQSAMTLIWHVWSKCQIQIQIDDGRKRCQLSNSTSCCYSSKPFSI